LKDSAAKLLTRDGTKDRGQAAGVINREYPRAIHWMSNFHFGGDVELLRPSYMFAIQVSSVTVITKNTNAIPIFLFVC
jgi:hypothetical protein